MEQVNKTKTDVKNQLLANLITSNRAENARLLQTNKRKRIEHRIDATAFKRTKLDEGVGSRRTFTTSQNGLPGTCRGSSPASMIGFLGVLSIKVILQLSKTSGCL